MAPSRPHVWLLVRVSCLCVACVSVPFSPQGAFCCCSPQSQVSSVLQCLHLGPGLGHAHPSLSFSRTTWHLLPGEHIFSLAWDPWEWDERKGDTQDSMVLAASPELPPGILYVHSHVQDVPVEARGGVVPWYTCWASEPSEKGKSMCPWSRLAQACSAHALSFWSRLLWHGCCGTPGRGGRRVPANCFICLSLLSVQPWALRRALLV